MTPDDKVFMRNLTANANRRSLSDDGKAVIIGSNSPATTDLVAKLSARFDFQDFSRLPIQNSNANLAANANMNR
jgi:hypothetical protein